MPTANHWFNIITTNIDSMTLTDRHSDIHQKLNRETPTQLTPKFEIKNPILFSKTSSYCPLGLGCKQLF